MKIIKKLFDLIEYGVIAISLIGMIIATIGMIVKFDDIKNTNKTLKTEYSQILNQCEKSGKNCEETK